MEKFKLCRSHLSFQRHIKRSVSFEEVFLVICMKVFILWLIDRLPPVPPPIWRSLLHHSMSENSTVIIMHLINILYCLTAGKSFIFTFLIHLLTKKAYRIIRVKNDTLYEEVLWCRRAFSKTLMYLVFKAGLYPGRKYFIVFNTGPWKNYEL